MKRIAIIEDDESIRDIVLYALQATGFLTAGFETGADFFASAERFDLLLLDIMLPEENGLAILKRLRSAPQTKALPVIMLTAKGSEFDKVTGLDAGADDYVTKPFGVMELISRVNAVLRRYAGDVKDPNVLNVGKLMIDHARREVYAESKQIALTYKEYELLHYLALNAGLSMSRDRIMETVWGFDFEGESRTLDMHIRTLRQKLGDAGAQIQTVRNVGYKLGEGV